MPERLLSAKDAAQFLDVHPVTLGVWRHEGRGPTYIKVSPQNVRYRLSDLEQFLEERTVTPGQK
jgi:predicted site-specific integrase-resolvase